MSKWLRGTAYNAQEVPVSAAEFWKHLLDWAAVMKCAPGPDVSPVVLVEGRLKEGHRLGTLPCTRIAVVQEGAGGPPTFDETLLYVDEAAKFIYYNIEGVSAGGLRNYLATTTVDEIAPDRCRVTCSSRFDLPEGGPVEQISAFLHQVYEHWVIRRITNVVLMERQAA